MIVPLCRPGITADERSAVEAVLDSGHLVSGPRVARFEQQLANWVDGREVVAVSSGTAALHVALWSLGVGPGDEVIVPGFTYPSPVNVVEVLGARSVVVDVDPRSAAMSPEAVGRAITAATRAIVVVHPFGIGADVEGIRAVIPAGRQVYIVEDAACAIGATTAVGPCGALGDIACFSFHPRKTITSVEGGAVIDTDPVRLSRQRALRNHGQVGTGPLAERFVSVGLNLRLSDVHAAVGCAQIDRLESLLRARRGLFQCYADGIAGIDGVEALEGLADPRSSVQSMIVCLAARFDRDSVIAGLKERGVESTVASYAIHTLPYYRERYGLCAEEYPVAEQFHRQAMTLPLFVGLKREEIIWVLEALKQALAEQ